MRKEAESTHPMQSTWKAFHQRWVLLFFIFIIIQLNHHYLANSLLLNIEIVYSISLKKEGVNEHPCQDIFDKVLIIDLE